MARTSLLSLLNSRTLRWFFVAYWVVYVGLNLLTLDRFPLPWQDEVYNSSITQSLLENGDFVPQVVKETTDLPNDLRYGPVFFWLTGLSFNIFGNNAFSLRLVTLLSGLAVLWITYRLFVLQSGKKIPAMLCIVLLSLDPFFFRASHEGRMEFTAAFLLYASLFLLLKIHYSRQKNGSSKNSQVQFPISGEWFWLLSGLCAVLSSLTTPRAGFLWIGLFPVIGTLFFHSFKNTLMGILFWSFPVLLLYSVWVVYAFGSFALFLNFYQSLTDHYTQLSDFYFYLLPNQYILLPIVAISVLYGFFQNPKKYIENPLVLGMLLSTAAFYLLVKDPGPYSAYLLPYWYLLLFSPLWIWNKPSA